MAIESEIIGSLNTPGYGFLNTAPNTYKLPKFPAGVSLITVRWNGSDEMSYDILDSETGSAVRESRTNGYALFSNFDSSTDHFEYFQKGALLRFNNSTPVQVYIIPNPRQAPPVWDGQGGV